MARRKREDLNGIDIKSFVHTIAAKLKKLFPRFAVYDDEIPQNGDMNCFHVGIISAKQKRVGIRRYKRDYDFVVSYYPADGSSDSFYEWEEKALTEFETLTVGGSTYRTKDAETSGPDGVWQLAFAVSFFIIASEEPVLMGDLKQIRGVKNGG